MVLFGMLPERFLLIFETCGGKPQLSHIRAVKCGKNHTLQLHIIDGNTAVTAITFYRRLYPAIVKTERVYDKTGLLAVEEFHHLQIGAEEHKDITAANILPHPVQDDALEAVEAVAHVNRLGVHQIPVLLSQTEHGYLNDDINSLICDGVIEPWMRIDTPPSVWISITR